ncbi:retinol dehydrogenase 12-like [Mizuhopecten yessoensis]|uniref:Retinol dehydrogenase 13 n=1 Tax=Mizuhopecten yessoensis TaxID=6573 RepID=A0A210QNT6_MIZYE|nr:retinol dehydrogenase 12-like [Mizuhopecten yessoensis]OWF50392.1 Retinol dehydrogenase 13 [Mizuhopecten yessoensis]
MDLACIEVTMALVVQHKVLISSVVGSVIGFALLRRHLAGGVCVSKKRLDGKTVIITGCNTGIGLETAKELSARGARVVMACRDVKKATEAAETVKTFSGNTDVSIQRLDLASLESVRKFAERMNEKEERIDILINNAGVMMCPKWKSEDGYEMQFAVNHLGHFLLTNLLLDRMKKSAPARIINVSSSAHYRGKINFDDINSDKDYSSMAAYAQSKLANVLFTKELSKRLQGTGVTTNALHPGVVNTELPRHVQARITIIFLLGPIIKPFLKTPLQGAQTNLHCALDENLDNVSGKYFSDCAEKGPSKAALVDEDAKRLWQLSEEMVANASK